MTLSTTSEKINAQGGLVLVGQLFKKALRLPSLIKGRVGNQKFSDLDIVQTAIGLLVQGRKHFSDAETFRQEKNEVLKYALGLNAIPSEATFRQRITKMAKTTAMMDTLRQANQNLLKTVSPSPIKVGEELYIPNDIDATPMNNEGSSREEVSYTYKGFEGYTPVMSNLGSEGYMLHHELRPGRQHSQKDTPEFLAVNFEYLKELNLKHKVLVRMDSGFDSGDTIEVLRNSGYDFIVKRNLRRENKVKFLSHAKAQGGPDKSEREGEEVYYGTIEHCVPGGEDSTQEPLTCAYKITERSIDKEGYALCINELEVDLYWTSLGVEAQEVVRLYQDHATSEQFHSELKSDMGIERFPSHSFMVNELFLMLGVLAYNVLRVIDAEVMQHVEAWPDFYQKQGECQQCRRVGSIIRDFILVASKVVKHAGRVTIKLTTCWPWTRVMQKVSLNL